MSLGGALASRVRQRVRSVKVVQPVAAGMLTRVVSQHDSQTDESRVQAGYLHVSSLLNFCPRMFFLAAVDKVRVTNFPSSADRVMWAIGRAIERHVRGAVTATVPRSSLIGVWSCACGKTKHEGNGVEKICNSCETPVDRYGELTVFDHDLKIAGNPDLLWETEQGVLVVEIKSMNKKAFDELTAPHANHVFQAAVYHKLLKNSGVRVTDDVAIFYGCKDYSFAGSPYREFHVPAASLDQIIEGSFEMVRGYRQAELSGVAPSKLSCCASPSSPVAKKCPVICNCFSRK